MVAQAFACPANWNKPAASLHKPIGDVADHEAARADVTVTDFLPLTARLPLRIRAHE
jgi:hypothetical protein